jgi:hypothetical protein
MDIGFLAPFKPDGDALLRQLARHVDDQMLAHAAEADYAGTEDHLAALRRIRDDGIIDRPLRWVPREVLELAQWADPDHPDEWDTRSAFSRPQRHRLRAFCCAALLRAYGDVETREIVHEGYGLALIQLLESLRCLDAGLERETMAALAWLIARLKDDPTELAFVGVGLLSVAATRAGVVPEATIVALGRITSTCLTRNGWRLAPSSRRSRAQDQPAMPCGRLARECKAMIGMNGGLAAEFS